jgi:hypothetical protein
VLAALAARADAGRHDLTDYARLPASDHARRWAQETIWTMRIHTFAIPTAAVATIAFVVFAIAGHAAETAPMPAPAPTATTPEPVAALEASSAEHCENPPTDRVANLAEFDRIKELAGTWEMKDPTGKNPPIRIEYALTAGGSAVTEREFAGTDGEMLSVYFIKSGKLHLVHYCGLGNRPEMALDSSDATSLHFGFVAGSLDDPDEMHMHELTISRPDADHFNQEWVMYNGGEAQDLAVFSYSRVK